MDHAHEKGSTVVGRPVFVVMILPARMGVEMEVGDTVVLVSVGVNFAGDVALDD